MSELLPINEPPMSLAPRRWPLVVATLVVYLAGAAAGSYFGWLSSDPYLEEFHRHNIDKIGGIFGLAFGLLAAVVWCWPMKLRTMRLLAAGRPLDDALVGWGTLWGAVVGLACSMAVHSSLFFAITEAGSSHTAKWSGIVFHWGVPFGIGVGLAAGFACGVVWRSAACATNKTAPQETVAE